MDKINPVSVGGLIVMGIKSAGLITSLLSISLLCMVVCWVILKLHDNHLYSSILDHFLLYVTKGRNNENMSGNNYKVDDEIERILLFMSRGDLMELVMERLLGGGGGGGSVFNCNNNNNPNGEEIRFGWQEYLFSENVEEEEEVKQAAFDVLDENNDGYIDEKELEKVLWKLGFQEFSERECRMMIKVYDDNGDGLIDFTEFSKLVEEDGQLLLTSN